MYFAAYASTRVSTYPAASSAARTWATWPSIIPESPRTCAPEAAWASAMSAYRSSVVSLSTTVRPVASVVSTPQCPWSVNSSRQRSVMTTSSSPTASTTARVAMLRIPSGSSAPEPRASLVSGTPKSMIPPIPAATQARASATSESSVCWTTPGIEEISTGSVMPSRTKTGRTRSAGCSRVSATRRRSGVLPRIRRGRTAGPGGRGLVAVTPSPYCAASSSSCVGRSGAPAPPPRRSPR